MSHECEDCSRTFETLSRLRLHDCSDEPQETGRDDIGNSATDDTEDDTEEDTEAEAEEDDEEDEDDDDAGEGLGELFG